MCTCPILCMYELLLTIACWVSSYNLTVIGRDRGDEPRSSNLTIFVTVTDVNDNAPSIFNVTSGVTMVNVIEVRLANYRVRPMSLYNFTTLLRVRISVQPYSRYQPVILMPVVMVKLVSLCKISPQTFHLKLVQQEV